MSDYPPDPPPVLTEHDDMHQHIAIGAILAVRERYVSSDLTRELDEAMRRTGKPLLPDSTVVDAIVRRTAAVLVAVGWAPPDRLRGGWSLPTPATALPLGGHEIPVRVDPSLASGTWRVEPASAAGAATDPQLLAVELLREMLAAPCPQDELGVCEKHQWLARDLTCAESRARHFVNNWDQARRG